MKKMLFIVCLFVSIEGQAQTDTDKLALAISAADEANTKQLMQFIWKRKSDVAIDGVVKLTTLTEFSFDDTGKLQTKTIDAQSSVKQQPGLRGKAQSNAAEDKSEYVQKALELSLAYTFMTKGQLLDFFTKATVAEKNGMIEATGENIYVKGDKLTLFLDAKTNLYTKKVFSSLLGTDPISGEINYEKFSSGINHGTTTILNMPAQKMKIDAKNQDYSQRVK
jgi:hypothetical protein